MPRDQLILCHRGCIQKDKLKVALASENACFCKSSLLTLIVISVLSFWTYQAQQTLDTTLYHSQGTQLSRIIMCHYYCCSRIERKKYWKSHKSLNIGNYLIDEYHILKLACLYITSCVHGHTIDFLMVKGNPPFLRKLLALFAFYNFRTSVGVTA